MADSAHSHSQPWTTSRCNRLLRPLSSRLTTLCKELDFQRRVETEASRTKSSRTATSNRTSSDTKPFGTRKPRNLDDDGAWRPNAPENKVKRTYGGRPRKKSTSSALARVQRDEVASNMRPAGAGIGGMATPLVVRLASSRYYESPQIHSSPLKGRQQRGPIVARIPQIRALEAQMGESHLAKLMHGLLDAYAKLLLATTPAEKNEKSRKGTRSLMSTCLHKMPAYIELEEYFAEQDKEENEEEDDGPARDISDEIYTHLEQTFAAGEGTGWRAFREMVRAHGTALMCDAFADGVFGQEALSAVVDVSTKSGAWQEAETFLWTFLSSSNFKAIAMPVSLRQDLFHPSTSAYMCLASKLVEKTGRQGFLFDLLEHMISQELLPLEWLATECMQPVFRRLLDSVAQHRHRTFGHAVRFLTTMMYVGVGLPDDSIFQDGSEVDVVVKSMKPSVRRELREGLEQVFNSTLSLLAGTALIGGSGSGLLDEKTVRRVTWVLDNIVIGLLRRNDIRSDLELLDTTTENLQTFAERALAALAASCAVHVSGCELGTDMVQLDAKTLVKSFSWATYQYSCSSIDIPAALSTLPAFFTQTSLAAGDPTSDKGFRQLQTIVEGLMALPNSRLPHKLWSLKRMALETSIAFAETTNQREHFAYTRKIEKSMSLKGRVVLMATPRKETATPSAPRGWRLEEGIGEWVAVTPYSKAEVAKGEKGCAALGGMAEVPDSQLGADEPGETPAACQIADVDEEQLWGETPIRPRCSTSSSLGKRTRTSSPMVVVPVKRARSTPPPLFDEELASIDDSGISLGSEIEILENRTRRPRRAKANMAESKRRTSGRNVVRKSYVEPAPVDLDDEATSEDDEEDPEEEEEQDAEEDQQEEIAESSDEDEVLQQSPSAESDKENRTIQDSEAEDDIDELGKTPAALKAKLRAQQRSFSGVQVRISKFPATTLRTRGSSAKVEVLRSQRSTRRSLLVQVKDSEDEGSDDELSFGF